METLFIKILDMSISGSCCILFVTAVRLFLKRVPKIYSYILWSAVLLRLTFPFFPESGFGLIPAAGAGVSGQRVYDQELIDRTEVYYGQTNHWGNSYGWLQKAGLTDANQPKMEPAAAKQDRGTGQPMITHRNVSMIQTFKPWVTIYSRLWAAGTAILLAFAAGSAGVMSGRLKTARRLSDGLYESDRVESPFLFGVLNPRIYLPVGISEEEELYIIKHETVHLKRRDYLIKPLAFLTVCVHWFNPLAWLAFFLMSRDMEMSCDESVIRDMGEGAKTAYSHTLLNMAVNRRFFAAGPLAFGENDTKARIRNVLSYRRPAFRTAAAVTLLAAVAIAVLMTNRRTDAPAQYEPAQSAADEKSPDGPAHLAADGSSPGSAAGSPTVGNVPDGPVGPQADASAPGSAAGLPADVKSPGGAAGLPSDKEQDPAAYNAALREPYRQTALTMELLSGDLAPIDKPTLEDYCGYTNAKWPPLEERSSDSLTDLLRYELRDDRTQELYILQVYYYIEDNTLSSVLLIRDSDGAAILLYDIEPRFAENRNRDVETFLNTKEDMSAFLTYELPENAEKGPYRADIGQSGGEIFTWTGEGEGPPAGSDWTTAEWQAAGGVLRFYIPWTEEDIPIYFKDGRLIQIPVLWNHTAPLSEPESLDGCELPALLIRMDHDLYTAAEVGSAEQEGRPIPEEDQTVQMTYIFFARADSPWMYCVYLNERCFTRQDAEALARSVRFTDRAFLPD